MNNMNSNTEKMMRVLNAIVNSDASQADRSAKMNAYLDSRMKLSCMGMMTELESERK